MVTLRRGRVAAIGAERPGAVELRVEVEADDGEGRLADAISYPALTGPIRVGDEVLLNTTAVDLGLGTGGFHFVVSVTGSPRAQAEPPGRVMKARYTPLQTAVHAIEETHAGE